jgi:hypothetical protein
MRAVLSSAKITSANDLALMTHPIHEARLEEGRLAVVSARNISSTQRMGQQHGHTPRRKHSSELNVHWRDAPPWASTIAAVPGHAPGIGATDSDQVPGKGSNKQALLLPQNLPSQSEEMVTSLHLKWERRAARSIPMSASSVVYGARAYLMSCCCPIRCVFEIYVTLTTAKRPSTSRAGPRGYGASSP